MKKSIILYTMFFAFTSYHYAGMPHMSAPSGGSVFDKMPTQEELEEINRYLETLSPEDLEELAKIGEEIIKEAEKEGKPLFPQTPKPQEAPKSTKPKSTKPKPAKKEETAKPKVPEISIKDKTALQKMLTSLVESIASIRQKAVSDEKLSDILLPENTLLNDMTYYLNVVNYSKYLGCLMDVEFTPLRKELEKLATQLADSAEQLKVPEITAKKLDKIEQEKQKKMLKEAEKILTLFVNTIKTTNSQKHIITDLERILKKYEPEALKIKQEREATEKKALTQTKTLPTTNTKVISAGSSKSSSKTQKYAGGPGPRNFGGGYMPAGATIQSRPGYAGSSQQNAPQNQKSTSAAKDGKDGKKDTKDDKKKDEKRKLTPEEESGLLAEEIKERLHKINTQVTSNKDRLHNFVSEYVLSKDPVNPSISSPMKDMIESITFDINRTKKKVGEWLTKVAKHTETAADYKKHTNALRSFMKTEFSDAQELFDKVKIETTKMPIASPRSEAHKGDMTDLSSAFDKLYKEIDKVV